jgi:prepilin-type N-terminal cleavage/methylation domain-containing protein
MSTLLRRSARAGFSMVELAIGLAILSVLVLALNQSLGSVRALTSGGSAQTRLQLEAAQALRDVAREVQRSGFVPIDASHGYPYVFDDGAPPDADMALHAHVPATQTAQPGDADFGPSREVVLVTPLDADADGRPDIGPDGRLIWSPAVASFVVVTGNDGVNVLQRRTNGGSPRTVARYVERFVCDTSAQDPVNVPLGALRVRLWLRTRDEKGVVYRLHVEETIKLRNG